MISKVRVVIDHEQWHHWFAWRPVRVYAGDSSLYVRVWLRTIERKLIPRYDDYTAKYRLLK